MSYKKKNFSRDLQIGNAGQALVITELIKAEVKSEINKDKNIKYDVKVISNLGQVKTLEVKYDLYAARSGNIAIEFFNPKSGKHSGIGITEADFWVHVLSGDGGVWICRVSQLKSFLETNKPNKIIAAGGDDNASLYLYKKEVILPVFYRLDKLSPNQIVSFIFNGGEIC